MNMIRYSLLPLIVAANAYAASVDDILNYDMQGISLSQSIDAIQNTMKSRGFESDSWPKNDPNNWKFMQKHQGVTEVYEVRLDRAGAVKSIRYQKSVPRDDRHAIDMAAEYKLLSSMVAGERDNCIKNPGGGFQCVLHARQGSTRASLSARTGHGTVYINASR